MASAKRCRNAAIESRVTASFGQYALVDVHPSVIARFLTHSTLGQNGLPASTSAKPAQGTAMAADGIATQAASSSDRTDKRDVIIAIPSKRRHAAGATCRNDIDLQFHAVRSPVALARSMRSP